jgi:hypothetical protein
VHTAAGCASCAPTATHRPTLTRADSSRIISHGRSWSRTRARARSIYASATWPWSRGAGNTRLCSLHLRERDVAVLVRGAGFGPARGLVRCRARRSPFLRRVRARDGPDLAVADERGTLPCTVVQRRRRRHLPMLVPLLQHATLRLERFRLTWPALTRLAQTFRCGRHSRPRFDSGPVRDVVLAFARVTAETHHSPRRARQPHRLRLLLRTAAPRAAASGLRAPRTRPVCCKFKPAASRFAEISAVVCETP